MLLQDWSRQYRNFMVVILNSWIVTVYPFAPWKMTCSMCHSFSFLFLLHRTWRFMSNSTGVSRKAEDAYSTRAPGLCSQFLVESVFFVVYVCFPCLVCVPGLHSFDYQYNLGSLDFSFWSKMTVISFNCLLWHIIFWFVNVYFALEYLQFPKLQASVEHENESPDIRIYMYNRLSKCW